jgi:phage shock protein PspC (stress-responsive transcriptional regulator)
MNKTVNINLAGFFYHIDEDAYNKLQHYLKTIKRSFAGAAGEDEIIADIESRIAELFSERTQNKQQVISMNTVDEVIGIMGQPEDYIVDEDIFEDEPRKKTDHNVKSPSKKLFRDTDSNYIGGVAAGFGHYFGIDALWIRLLLILVVFLGIGTPILIYIILWIFVPEAKSTAEKLQMKGQPINISNIEKKIKEGIHEVTDTVKNVDYEKHSQGARNGIANFFDGLGNVFMTLLRIFGKVVGVILITAGITVLIMLVLGLFSIGSMNVFGLPFNNSMEMNYFVDDTGIPFWLVAIFGFFTLAIPLFFLIYLGFKILVKNFKSMSNYGKFSLLGLWILSIIMCIFFTIKQGMSYKEKASVVQTEIIPIYTQDTLNLKMVTNDVFAKSIRRDYDFDIVYDDDDTKKLFSKGIRLIIKSTKDTIAKIKIEKSAKGATHVKARDRAKAIEYNYSYADNTLALDSYFLTNPEEKFKNQKTQITLYLPEGMIFYADENTYSYHNNTSGYDDIFDNGFEEHYMEVIRNDLKCLDCKGAQFSYEEGDANNNDRVIIDGDGFNITIDGEKKVIINEEGLNIDIDDSGENFKMNIDQDGLRIKKTNGRDGTIEIKELKAGDDGIQISKEKIRDDNKKIQD